jgi:hypothetical protein
MEDSWKQIYYDGSNPNDRVPEHMDVFYGADNDTSVEMETGDVQGDDSAKNGKNGSSMMQYGNGHVNGGFLQEDYGTFDQQGQNGFY